MAFESVRAYVQLASGLGDMTRAKAMEVAHGLLSLPGADEVTRHAVKASVVADQLLEAARANRAHLVELVRTEVESGMRRADVVRAADLDVAKARIAGLTKEVADLRAAVLAGGASVVAHRPLSRPGSSEGRGAVTTAPRPSAPSAEPAPGSRPAVKKTAAKKTAAKKTAAKKTTAKKTTAKKTAAKKTTAKRAPATKAAAKKTTATVTPAKQAVPPPPSPGEATQVALPMEPPPEPSAEAPVTAPDAGASDVAASDAATTSMPASAPAPTSPRVDATQTSQAEAGPERTSPAQTSPAQTSPAQTSPAQTSPAQTSPAQTSPAETGPIDEGPTAEKATSE